jgi:hypothetical protein
MSKTVCQPRADTRNPVDSYGYPATATILGITGNGEGESHRLAYPGAPGELFDGAPNTSELLNTLTGAVYRKTGDFGGYDGTWTETPPS